MKILDTLDPLSPRLRGTDGPDSKWLALLILMQGLAAYTREGKYTGKGFLYQPFRLCIDAIEYYRLNTDKPCLRPSAETEEATQETKKGRPRRSYEQQQAEAVLAEEWKTENADGMDKVTFAEKNGYSLADFDRLLDRVYRQGK